MFAIRHWSNTAKGFCPEYKSLCLGQIQHNTSLSTTLHIFKHGGGCIMLWVCLSSSSNMKLFLFIKRNGIELRTGKTLEESLVQSAFQQTLGDKFTFQQDNNLKHKAKYTLESITKKTVNDPEWPSHSFDLNWLESLWQDLKMVVWQWSTTNLTEIKEFWKMMGKCCTIQVWKALRDLPRKTQICNRCERRF